MKDGKPTALVLSAPRPDQVPDPVYSVRQRLLEMGYDLNIIPVGDITKPEVLIRAVPLLKHDLGELDLLVYMALPLAPYASRPELMRALESELSRQVLAMINAIIELQPLCTPDTRILVLTSQPRNHHMIQRLIVATMFAFIAAVGEAIGKPYISLRVVEDGKFEETIQDYVRAPLVAQ